MASWALKVTVEALAVDQFLGSNAAEIKAGYAMNIPMRKGQSLPDLWAVTTAEVAAWLLGLEIPRGES